MNCDNPFHFGGRPEFHSSKVGCVMRRLKTAGSICANKCHTHREHSPTAEDLDLLGVIRLFDRVVNGHDMHLAKISRIELEEVADYYLGIRGDELLEVLRRRAA